jgi:hypothetical protein
MVFWARDLIQKPVPTFWDQALWLTKGGIAIALFEIKRLTCGDGRCGWCHGGDGLNAGEMIAAKGEKRWPKARNR